MYVPNKYWCYILLWKKNTPPISKYEFFPINYLSQFYEISLKLCFGNAYKDSLGKVIEIADNFYIFNEFIYFLVPIKNINRFSW